MTVAPIAAGSPPGGLDQTVDRLQDAVADAAVEPAQHSVPVVDDGVGEGLEGFELTAAIPDPLAPVGEVGLGQLVGCSQSSSNSSLSS